MDVINLTPHAVNIGVTRFLSSSERDERVVTFPISGRIARVEEQTESLIGIQISMMIPLYGEMEMEIPVVRKSFGEVYVEDTSSKERSPFPPPKEGVIYIVFGARTLCAAPHEGDAL